VKKSAGHASRFPPPIPAPCTLHAPISYLSFTPLYFFLTTSSSSACSLLLDGVWREPFTSYFFLQIVVLDTRFELCQRIVALLQCAFEKLHLQIRSPVASGAREKQSAAKSTHTSPSAISVHIFCSITACSHLVLGSHSPKWTHSATTSPTEAKSSLNPN
jgi:hypothetical protein